MYVGLHVKYPLFLSDFNETQILSTVSSLLFQLCTSLYFKTFKIRPYIFRSPLKPSSGGPWPSFARLLNSNVDLHLL
jgi:hypothetical protein